MALNNFICNHLMPLHFKGLIQSRILPIIAATLWYCSVKACSVVGLTVSACYKENVCPVSCDVRTLGLRAQHGGPTATKQWPNVATFQRLDQRGFADAAVTQHQQTNTREWFARDAQLTSIHLPTITNNWLQTDRQTDTDTHTHANRQSENL